MRSDQEWLAEQSHLRRLTQKLDGFKALPKWGTVVVRSLTFG